MQTHNLGCPRIGSNRKLKKACRQYWSDKAFCIISSGVQNHTYTCYKALLEMADIAKEMRKAVNKTTAPSFYLSLPIQFSHSNY